ncbi:anti-sigma factor family protein [Actinoallomurus sp. CA-150999]|uniref:anti-sigma factor family protein n=1 Tax=Actinoallomurus sp. CA-150999 TaxID=3239887 RepID=UPI003D912E57
MSVEHTDVGAYVLGLLEEDDRRAFEEHLTGCASCGSEVESLGGMRTLLTGVAPIDGASGASPEGVTDLLSRRRQAARRRRRGTLLIGVAAGAAIVAGGVTIGAVLTNPSAPAHNHGSPAADLLASGERHSATDPVTHASGTVATDGRPWGTMVALDLAGVRGPLTCRLVAVTRSGQRSVVTEWAVPPKGYGVPGAPAHLQVHGGTAAQRSQIVRFDVSIENGGTLLRIPV